MFENLLPFLSGLGGAPASTPPIAPPQAPPQAPPPFLDRLKTGLFGPADTPEAKAAQNKAFLQLGLGMLAAGSRGQGLGEGVFNSYAMASRDFEGAMDKAFQNTERKRLEEKQDKIRETAMAREDARDQRDYDWRKNRAEAEDKYREGVLRSQAVGRADDAATARVRNIEARMKEKQLLRLEELERKRASGALSSQEATELQALTTGARLGYEPQNPWAALFQNQGLGGGFGPPAGGNPLIGDPRL